jgi:hypothetical protein
MVVLGIVAAAALGIRLAYLSQLEGSPLLAGLMGVLLAIYPAAIFFDGLIQKSSLDIFLVTLLLAAAGEFAVKRDLKWAATLGVATALFAVNRENARILFPVIGVWVWWLCRGERRQRLAAVASFAIASLAVVMPIALRNYAVGPHALARRSLALLAGARAHLRAHAAG